MPDLQLRSTRLDSMPPIGEPPLKRLISIAIRWGLFLGGLGIVVFGIILPIGLRWYPVTPDQPLYLLHDHVYLTLKGQLFTRFYPFSLIFIGCMIPIFLLLFTSLLYIRMIRFLQIKSYQLLLWRGYHENLQKAARYFYRRFKLRPQVMLVVVSHSLEANLINLSKRDFHQANAGLCNRIVAALDLYIHLYVTYYRRNHIEMDEMMLDTFERWHRTLLLLTAYADETAYAAVGERMRALFAVIGEPATQSETDDVYSLVVIWQDLAELEQLSLRQQYGSRHLLVRDSGETSVLIRMQRVSDHVNTRCLRLQRITLDLQRSLQNMRTALLSQEEAMALPQDSPMLNHLVSRLALNIAAHLALLLDHPAPVRAYLESLEALALVLPTVDNTEILALIDAPPANLPSWNPAHILFRHLPMADSRCIIGLLSERYYQTQKSQLAKPYEQVDRKAPLLVKADFNFALKSTNQWFYAADLQKGADDAE